MSLTNFDILSNGINELRMAMCNMQNNFERSIEFNAITSYTAFGCTNVQGIVDTMVPLVGIKNFGGRLLKIGDYGRFIIPADGIYSINLNFHLEVIKGSYVPMINFRITTSRGQEYHGMGEQCDYMDDCISISLPPHIFETGEEFQIEIMMPSEHKVDVMGRIIRIR